MKKTFKKLNYRESLFSIYVFLFCFTMINREFLFLGLDLRYINLLLSIILIIYCYIKRTYKENNKMNFDSNIILVFTLYLWLLCSNCSWLWNGLELDIKKIINETILLINNLLFIIVIYLNKKIINKNYINKCILFSCFILFISIILLQFGIDAHKIGTDPSEIYIYSSGTHVNLFGGNYRIGGYAQDPNYATMFFVIGIVAVLQIDFRRIFKALFIGVFTIGIALSFSKSVILAVAIAMLYYIITKKIKNENKVKIINIILFLGIICVAIFSIRIKGAKDILPTTITTRFSMWNQASELLKKNILIGNGITSFRTYYATERWYVHCHSTYWQLLSETGVLGLCIYIYILYKLLNKSSKSNKFIIIIYLIFGITNETIALQMVMYIFIITQLPEKNNSKTGKKALFMINTLSNGGAERVAVVMAEELIKQKYAVDFILIGNNADNIDGYTFNPKINVYNLNINYKNKFLKILKMILSIHKINQIVLENEKYEKYELITSHLPMSNLLTRFSIIRNRAIYVLHTTMRLYDKHFHKVFKLGVKYVYGNKKVVAVSQGLSEECIKIYGLSQKNVKTIYNPIDFENIEKKSKEKTNYDGKYFVQVGRLSEIKRQDRMIDVFYKGGFYKKYKLYFCGLGSTKEKLEEKAKILGIQDKVVFLGWQDNIYKWMKNSELLVMTSDIEAFPMTLIEAMACNTKIVASNCQFGPSEILVGEYANYLVEPDNIDDYIRKINLALNKYPKDENPVLKECYPKNVIKKYIEFMR